MAHFCEKSKLFSEAMGFKLTDLLEIIDDQALV